MSGPTPWASWQEVVDKTPSFSMWNKVYGTSTYWSLYNQYTCHTDYVPFKKISDAKNSFNGQTEYHIEPWRSNKGYWGFVSSQCN